MFRFYFTIIFSFFSILYFLGMTAAIKKNPDKFSEEKRYSLVQFACRTIQKRGNIENDIYGQENLPTEGGYIMYPNHQGRFDVIGIVLSHDNPLSYVIDKKRSKTLILDQATFLLNAKRLDKSDMRNQVRIINQVSDEVLDGRKYVIFPEGGYGANVDNNDIHEFMPGAFKAAIKAKCPIVPVALVDSYKVYLKNSLRKVKCQIYYLEPILFDEYKNLNSHQIADLVKDRICDKMREVQAI